MRKASVLAAMILLTTPAISHAKTLEELLVEKGVISKAEVRDEITNAPARVYYNGGTRIDFADAGFSTKINTLIQTRYTFYDGDERVSDHNTSSFDVKHAKLIVTGNALHEEFSYGLVTDFVGNADATGTKQPTLQDAWVQWNGCDWFSAKMGQFATGISRQFETNDMGAQRLQFVDTTVVSDYFSLGRQQGASANGMFMDGKLTWSAGIYNGQSDGEGMNAPGVDTKHTGIITGRWNVMGTQDPFVESDVDWTEAPALNVGAAYAHADYNHTTGSGTSAFMDNTGADVVNLDGIFKYQGLSLSGEYFVAHVNPDVAAKQTPQGFYVQAGYFLKPKTLEIAARYGLVDCDNGKAGGACSAQNLDSINEASATINYYWWKNQLKAQFGYDLVSKDIIDVSKNSNTNKWIFQLSAYL